MILALQSRSKFSIVDISNCVAIEKRSRNRAKHWTKNLSSRKIVTFLAEKLF